MDEDDTGVRAGFFKNYHVDVLRELTDADLNRLASCRDNTERFDLVQSLPCLNKRRLPVECISRQKSLLEARNQRLQGNEAFKQKELRQALSFYNAAVLNAPSQVQGEEAPELALALANRSAVLIGLGNFAEALDDIEEALQSGYPCELRQKLVDRKAKCIQAGAKTINKRGDVAKLPEVTRGCNQNYPTATDKLSIEESPAMGRYAVAESQIRVGDVLVVEKPFASVINPEKYATHCINCYATLRVIIPCPTCSRIAFCSRRCRQQAMQNYHSIECCIIDYLYSASISITCYLALRMITIKPLQFYLDVKPFLPDQDPLQRNEDSSLTSEMEKYLATYNLVTHAERRDVKGFFHLSLMAHFLVQCLRAAGYFGSHTSAEGDELSEQERWIGKLLLHHVQLLQFNAHEVSELQMARPNSLDGIKAMFVGAAVYPTLALFNHSCEPGIVRYFVGDTVVVRAIRTIKQGELIAENYGPIYSQKSRQQRQNLLRERYWFDCQCRPCVEDWPLFDNIDRNAFRFRCTAAQCGRALPVDSETLSPFVSCRHCKSSHFILKSLQDLQATEATFNKAKDLIERGQFLAALSYFIQTLSKLDEVLCPPYPDYLLCQEGARKCLLSLGNVRYTDPAAQ